MIPAHECIIGDFTNARDVDKNKKGEILNIEFRPFHRSIDVSHVYFPNSWHFNNPGWVFLIFGIKLCKRVVFSDC